MWWSLVKWPFSQKYIDILWLTHEGNIWGCILLIQNLKLSLYFSLLDYFFFHKIMLYCIIIIRSNCTKVYRLSIVEILPLFSWINHTRCGIKYVQTLWLISLLYSITVVDSFWGPFYWHGLTLILAWISHHMFSKVWGEITYPKLQWLHCWCLGMDK